jgi:hypothetical protein
MDPEQPAPPCILIRIHAVRLQTLLQIEILIRLRGRADWSGSMLVANALRWLCHNAARMVVVTWKCVLDLICKMFNDHMLTSKI